MFHAVAQVGWQLKRDSLRDANRFEARKIHVGWNADVGLFDVDCANFGKVDGLRRDVGRFEVEILVRIDGLRKGVSVLSAGRAQAVLL